MKINKAIQEFVDSAIASGYVSKEDRYYLLKSRALIQWEKNLLKVRKRWSNLLYQRQWQTQQKLPLKLVRLQNVSENATGWSKS